MVMIDLQETGWFLITYILHLAGNLKTGSVFRAQAPASARKHCHFVGLMTSLTALCPGVAWGSCVEPALASKGVLLIAIIGAPALIGTIDCNSWSFCAMSFSTQLTNDRAQSLPVAFSRAQLMPFGSTEKASKMG